MKSLRFRSVAALCALVAAAALVCTSGRAVYSQKGASKAAGVRAAAGDTLPGFDLASLDRSVSACTDFNQFANGGWGAKDPAPGAHSRWGGLVEVGEPQNAQPHPNLEGV